MRPGVSVCIGVCVCVCMCVCVCVCIFFFFLFPFPSPPAFLRAAEKEIGVSSFFCFDAVFVFCFASGLIDSPRLGASQKKRKNDFSPLTRRQLINICARVAIKHDIGSGWRVESTVCLLNSAIK